MAWRRFLRNWTNKRAGLKNAYHPHSRDQRCDKASQNAGVRQSS